ncbi:MAG: hypothetical protein J5676_00640 [Bacteroidaceae bacterium]|nr:hypothetical protein [Bacteroidaceae bacterium]
MPTVLPLNLLAEGVLYDKTIGKVDSEIFDLSLIRGNDLNTNIQCSINDDGDIVGTIRNVYKGIEAEKFKLKYHESADSLALIDNIERRYGCKLKTYKTKNVDGIGLSAIEQYYFSKAIDKIGDRLFFNPMIFASEIKNYFTDESREMPVEFPNLQKTEIKALMMLPDDYEVEEIPTARSFKFREGEIEVKIDISLEGKMLNAVYTFSINTPLVVPQHYAELQKFWKEVLDINSQRVVLKKKA